MIRRRNLLTAAIIVQFAVPAAALIQPPPTRFGFQMYSGQGNLTIEVLDGAGQPIEVELTNYFAAPPRLELDWTKKLPEHLCTVVPEAALVTVTQPDQSRSLTC
jgi:hypothetical protein